MDSVVTTLRTVLLRPGGARVGHREARLYAWVYARAVLAGFLLSLPDWRALGLAAG